MQYLMDVHWYNQLYRNVRPKPIDTPYYSFGLI